MNPTAKDRLLENLPPGQRPYFDRCLHKLAPSPDDPLIALFAIITESDKTNTATIEAKLAAFEQQQKQIPALIAKGQAETQKSYRAEINSISGKNFCRNINITQLIGAFIWLTVVIASNHIIQNKVWTLNPEQIERLESKIEEQTQLSITNFEKLTNNQKNIVDYVGTVKETTVKTASETLIGKGISQYVTDLDEKNITVETNGRRITVPHQLTPQEYLQLNIALEIAKGIK